MILYLVTHADYDDFGIHGLYAKKEDAETHCKLEQKIAKLNKYGAMYLEVQEMEVLEEAPFIYYSHQIDWAKVRPGPTRVGFSIPEPYLRTEEVNGKQVHFGEAYGSTPEEAKAALEAALAAL